LTPSFDIVFAIIRKGDLMATPRFKEMERAYGFEEVAIVPGDVTVNPDQTNTSFNIGPFSFKTPIIASAMDGVVDPKMAVEMHKLGGLAVLNLDGIHSRHENPAQVLQEIAQASDKEVTSLLQKIYSEPIKDHLIAKNVKAIKSAGAVCAVSVIPATAKKLGLLAKEAGADILVVASTVTTARHISKSYHGLVFSELIDLVKLPVVVGNCVTYTASLELMRTGIDGLLVGVGPGAACTSREVLGIGVPQITATMDCATARETFFKETGKYVTVITDGGIRIGSDFTKCFASGADAVMIGSPLASTLEAPGHGFHWGMANPHPELPRGTRIRVGQRASLKQVLFGPTSLTNGSENLMGALKTCMGVCGALTIKDMHKVRMVIAPSIKTEGKYFQTIQGLSNVC
jgi:IMP dehydrogenase